MAVKQKTKHGIHLFAHLKHEYQQLHKPGAKKLARMTFSVMAGAICGACVISGIDAIFSQMVKLFM